MNDFNVPLRTQLMAFQLPHRFGYDGRLRLVRILMLACMSYDVF